MNHDSIKTNTQKTLVLVIEDDRALREGLAMNLRMEGYSVLAAANGDEGMKMAFDANPDLIVLDIMMPSWSGLDILEELRKQDKKMPVLILSARNSTTNKVEGLNLGADDYMTKPFDLNELIARIQAMLRREKSKDKDAPELRVGDIVIYPSSRIVHISGRETDLSAKEFDLLRLLAESPDKVFTRETILRHVWGWDYEGTERTVDNFVANLRKKLNSDKRPNRIIITVPRVGYKLSSE